MGNTTSATLYTRPADSTWDFTASDLLLDQMEKQVSTDQETASAGWIESAARFCAMILITIAMMLVGNLSGPLEHTKKTPILVDAACQTEDEVAVELTVNKDWQPCHVDSKDAVDEDTHSCTTETTESFTDVDYEQDFKDDDFEWESVSSAADDILYAIRDACEDSVDCDWEAQVDRLLHLTAIVCAEHDESSALHLEDYLCTCGECPQYKTIANDVTAVNTSECNVMQTNSTMRLLQAFSTYNEALGYHAEMIPAARECLRVWCGDEDKAFKSFVTLYDEVPQLCGALHYS
ncbi:unnamed protein product [Phytophthora lilii]|uniref:Unnamed protein product n=1 Tax=Phytophthora lilii TaxID=2077276 RepID=A0A9W6WWY7_9STRA|nr:unnamed protein product [Phytophthora lilii]